MEDSKPQPRSLVELCDCIADAKHENGRVKMRAVVDMIGRRSFGPLLLLAGLLTVAPGIGDFPGVPTMAGVFVALISGQLLVGRESFWLPEWMLERSVKAETLCKTVGKLRRVAAFIDRFVNERFVQFVKGPATYIAALVCLLIAFTMPAMEVVLLVANLAGAVLVLFGLSLIGRDGAMAATAFALSVVMFGALGYGLMGA